MVIDNPRDNIQAHPESRKGTLLGRDRPVEALKDPPLQFPWDANPLIAHTDGDRLGLGVKRHIDKRSIWSIFDGIAEQVQEHLYEPIPISDHESGGGSMLAHNGMRQVHVRTIAHHFL